jgi:hypothetical protein
MALASTARLVRFNLDESFNVPGRLSDYIRVPSTPFLGPNEYALHEPFVLVEYLHQ